MSRGAPNRPECGETLTVVNKCLHFAATFERRRTPIPASLPLALTPGFAAIPGKQVQWQGFLRKNDLLSAPEELSAIIARISTFLEPAITAARSNLTLDLAWPPGGPWKAAS